MQGKWTAKATRSLSKAVCNKKPLREDAAAGIYSENRLCIHRIHRQTQSLCQFSSGDA
jgi:hypothetical protein